MVIDTANDLELHTAYGLYLLVRKLLKKLEPKEMSKEDPSVSVMYKVNPNLVSQLNPTDLFQ